MAKTLPFVVCGVNYVIGTIFTGTPSSLSEGRLIKRLQMLGAGSGGRGRGSTGDAVRRPAVQAAIFPGARQAATGRAERVKVASVLACQRCEALGFSRLLHSGG